MAVNRISRAFQVPRKGETFELRAGLVSQYAWERKESIQRTIQSMTLGKDVSALFPDVLKNIATGDIDQKKLVYLYLMNYAKSHPDLCILAVNTFVQDSEDPNPLIRALAIRTMGCIRVEKMLDYMEDPLRKTLRDESPYVRKTAVICVAKLFDLNPAMCLENGFLENLQEMIGDPNPMVVANCVAALSEIHEAAPETGALQVTPAILKKMLMALNECTEWGRITILTTLADYRAADPKESEHICERVSPQFQHVNPSVVLSAVKVMFLHMPFIPQELHAQYIKKMAPPLVTLISTAPEVQYVALRNIELLLQKQPDILTKEIRVFFCKYNDPPYLKLAKIEIMVRISNDRNYEQLLGELKEYAMEVDMDFVRRAVKAVGQVAIKIEAATEKCVNALLDLIATKVNYVVQEAIVVIKDIFRKYPGYEGIIPTLCQCIDELDEPNARSALIWIVGEYAEKISNAAEILGGFVDGFKEEFTQVQLQILTSTIKLYLKRPEHTQRLVQKILTLATAETDNPDIRDRTYIYWRLLSSDPSVTRQIVLSDRPPITSTISSTPSPLLEELIMELSTLASVYHKPPSSFLGGGKYGIDAVQRAAIEEQMQNARDNPIAAAAAAAAVGGGGANTQAQAQAQAQQNNAENLLDIDFDGAAPASLQKQPQSEISGLEGLAGTPQRVQSPSLAGSAPTSAVASHPAAGAAVGAMASSDRKQAGHADELADLFGTGGGGGGGNGAAVPPAGGNDDLMNGFASLDMGSQAQPPPPPTGQQMKQGEQKSKNDLMDLF